MVHHGESTANAGGRGETPAGTRLTARGHEQAKVAANLLAELVPGPATKILVSPFIRTQETAAPYAWKFDIVPEEWPIQEWIFLDPKNYVGTTQAERVPDVRAFEARRDPHYVDGAAESFAAFMYRVDLFLAGARAWGGQLVAFTHGRFIRGVLWRLQNPGETYGWTRDHFESFFAFSHATEVTNCQVFELRYENDWQLVE
jgi:broad specificity phosphatase PhoE